MALNLRVFIAIKVFFLSSSAFSFSLKLNNHLTHATDASPIHPMAVNPASYQTEKTQMDLLSYRNRIDSQYRENDDANPSIQKTRANQNYIGFSLRTDLGSGMWFGLQYAELTAEYQSNFNQLAFRDIEEEIQSRSALAIIAVELADGITFGFNLENLTAKYSIVGSYFIDPESFTTNYSTELLGSSTGLKIEFAPFFIGLTYAPALKGKTEILGEEFIVTEPGHSDIQVALDASDVLKIGLLYRRHLYKRDDRHQGTTVNNEDDSPISPYGVWAVQNFLYPLETTQIGFEYQFPTESWLVLTYETIACEFNTNPYQVQPGENDQADSDKINRFKGLFVLERGELHFHLGYHKIDSNLRFGENSNQRTMEIKEQDIWLGLGTKL